MNATIEDTDEHAALSYGRHSAGEIKEEDLRVAFSGAHRAPEDWTPHADLLGVVFAATVVARLKSERLAVDKAPITEVMQVAAPFWDTDTPEGVLLKPRYPVGPPKREMHDPEATVGFIPLDDFTKVDSPPVPGDAPPVSYDEFGRPGFRYDAPPPGHETDAWSRFAADVPFAPIDTRVKRPPLWKLALLGLGLMKEKPNGPPHHS